MTEDEMMGVAVQRFDDACAEFRRLALLKEPLEKDWANAVQSIGWACDMCKEFKRVFAKATAYKMKE